MGLFSFLRRDRGAANERAPRGRRAGDLPSADVVRVQARRRLIGAAVLVVVAVLVLPWVFDSKPRPLPVDIPIEVPKRDLSVALPEPPPPRPQAAPALQPEPDVSQPAMAPQATAPAAAVIAPSAPKHAEVPKPVETPKVEKSAEAPKDAKSVESPKPAEPRKTAEVRKPAEPPKPALKPEPAKSDPPKPAKAPADAARAQAMLEGREPAAASSRFVVQVGAFEQADGAREARQRVAKAGLQAHESTVQTADGKRIRVRLGPYASREEADKAAAKLRAAGLGGAVMPQ